MEPNPAQSARQMLDAVRNSEMGASLAGHIMDRDVDTFGTDAYGAALFVASVNGSILASVARLLDLLRQRGIDADALLDEVL